MRPVCLVPILALALAGSPRLSRADGLPMHWEAEKAAALAALKRTDPDYAAHLVYDRVEYDRGTGLFRFSYYAGAMDDPGYRVLVADQGRLVAFAGDGKAFAKLLIAKGILTDHPSLTPVQVAELAMRHCECKTVADPTADPYRPAPPSAFRRTPDSGVTLEWGARNRSELDFTDLQAIRYSFAVHPDGALAMECRYVLLPLDVPEYEQSWNEKPPLNSVLDWQLLEEWRRPPDGGRSRSK